MDAMEKMMLAAGVVITGADVEMVENTKKAKTYFYFLNFSLIKGSEAQG